MRYRMLVVDDNIDTVDLLMTALDSDFEVFGIDKPDQTFAAIEVGEPDLVVLDLMMPRISGFDVLDRAEELGGVFKRIPYVVLSCKKGVDDQKKAYEKGASMFYHKPFEPDRLLRNMKMFMGNSGIAPGAKQYRVEELARMIELRESYHSWKVVKAAARAPVEHTARDTFKASQLRQDARGGSGDEKDDDDRPKAAWLD